LSIFTASTGAVTALGRSPPGLGRRDALRPSSPEGSRDVVQPAVSETARAAASAEASSAAAAGERPAPSVRAGRLERFGRLGTLSLIVSTPFGVSIVRSSGDGGHP